jgi:hypothetical protein
VLHPRVIAPVEQACTVLALLTDEPGATHMTTLPGVAIKPVGDVIEA